MKRQIFEVYAKIVDANGAYNTPSGYPKVFDSHQYNDDIDKALKRAKGEYHDTIGALSKRDDRQQQMVLIMTADGFLLEDPWVDGKIADLPDPEPIEEEPIEEEPQEEPEGE